MAAEVGAAAVREASKGGDDDGRAPLVAVAAAAREEATRMCASGDAAGALTTATAAYAGLVWGGARRKGNVPQTPADATHCAAVQMAEFRVALRTMRPPPGQGDSFGPLNEVVGTLVSRRVAAAAMKEPTGGLHSIAASLLDKVVQRIDLFPLQVPSIFAEAAVQSSLAGRCVQAGEYARMLDQVRAREMWRVPSWCRVLR